MSTGRLQPVKDEDLLGYTTDSVFDSMLSAKNPEEQRSIAAHLLWLHNYANIYIEKLHNEINNLSRNLDESRKMPAIIKGNIRRKALKQLTVRRRLLEVKP
jgi:hypothetical protein